MTKLIETIGKHFPITEGEAHEQWHLMKRANAYWGIQEPATEDDPGTSIAYVYKYTEEHNAVFDKEGLNYLYAGVIVPSDKTEDHKVIDVAAQEAAEEMKRYLGVDKL